MQVLKSYLKVMEGVNKLLYWTIAALLAAISLLLVSQVFFRYVMNSSLSWTEEVARYLTIWTVFLGVAVAMRRRSLIALEIVVQVIPKKIEKVFRIIVLLFSLAFLLILLVYGFKYSVNISYQGSIALDIPMWIPYAAVPVGAFLTILNLFVVLIELVTERGSES